MRISLYNLFLPRVELELPGPEQEPCVLTIEHLSDMNGTIARDGERLDLEPLMVRELQVTGLEWHTNTGRIALGTPATVAGLTLAASVLMTGQRIAAATGNLTLDLADLENLTVTAAGQRLTCDARLAQLRVDLGQPGDECPAPGASQHSGRAAGAATLRALAMRNLQTTLGNLLVRIGGAAIDEVSASWQPGPAGEPVHVTTRVNSVILQDVTITSPLVELQVERIELTNGLAWDGRELHVGSVFVSRGHVRAPDLAALAAARTTGSPKACAQAAEEPPASVGEPPAPAAQGLSALDLSLLDRISGQLIIDVTIAADVPVLGQRRATHMFRVPVEHGIISYRRVEDGLANLEDWVFDFAVRGGALVLERDLVVSRKDLIRWPLDPEALALARDKRVRLRTLLDYQIPSTGSKSSIIEIREVVLGRIDLSLCVAPTEPLPGSGISGVAVAKLEVAGSLRHPPNNEQLVAMAANDLAAMIANLAVSGAAGVSARISIDALSDVKLVFSGLTPRSLIGDLHGVRATDLRVQRSQPAPR